MNYVYIAMGRGHRMFCNPTRTIEAARELMKVDRSTGDYLGAEIFELPTMFPCGEFWRLEA